MIRSRQTLLPVLVPSLLLAGLLTSGCRVFGRAPKASIPVVQPVVQPVVEPVVQPVIAPPPISTSKPTAPRRPTPSRRRVAAPAPPPAVIAPPPPPPAPSLGEILTPRQQAEYRRSWQQSSGLARQALTKLTGRALTPDQSDNASRIRSFLTQADDAATKDPASAAQLARRAELLARDLIDTLR